MMGAETWGVVLTAKRAEWDAVGRRELNAIRSAGRRHITCVESADIYLFRGRLTERAISILARQLLLDPVTQSFQVFEGVAEAADDDRPTVEVHYRPGVMDPVTESTLAAARRLQGAGILGEGIEIAEVRTARRFRFVGVRDLAELEWLAKRVLANDCIQRCYLRGFGRADVVGDVFAQAPQLPFERRVISLLRMDDAGLEDLSRRGHLFLSVDEMRAIQVYFASVARDPTDLELETFAQTWSEHCVHKTLKSDIIYRGPGFGVDEEVTVRFDNLLKSTIAAATERLNKDWCLSVFKDNAGVIALDDEWAVAFKVETHNHPSAIEPYGGAATGVGGCIRDILGCGLGAKPIASTDVFCLAPPDWPEERLPEGVFHPRRVLEGVVAGVRDYGNRMGIPTVNGAIVFDERFLTNPLVFCGCVGLIPRNRIDKAPRVGDRIVLVGGRTGRDGIHGATFSSSELTDGHADEFAHAVQIGNPIEEKKVLDALLRARDHESGCLFHAITDCGAGGLSSAVGEMAAELGAEVHLERVPLKYAGLRYDEIWISEAQERMVPAVDPNRMEELCRVFAEEGVEATDIGCVTGDGRLHVTFDGVTVGDLHVAFLHGGRPRRTREATWRPDVAPQPRARRQGEADVGDTIMALLGDLNVASKEWVIRQYDHEVQGGSVVKPLVGPGDGPADAAVLRPLYDRNVGVALACGLCPGAWGDPYVMAIRAVDEALRNVVCVGGDPGRTAILDNFCWGGVDTPESLGALVRACKGAHDAALAYGLPFISGKDSLNNQFTMSAAQARRVGLPGTVSIPDTLLISAIGVVADVRRCVTMDFKNPGNHVIYVRPYQTGDLVAAARVHQQVAEWIAAGKVVSAHDVSDGGAALAVAEMCIAGELGANIDWADRDGAGDVRESLFDEAPTRYILECPPDARIASDIAFDIGEVTATGRMRLKANGNPVADLGVDEMRAAWKRALNLDEGGSV